MYPILTAMKITQKKEVVRNTLTNDARTRDSDFMLIASIWWEELTESQKQNKGVRDFFVRLSQGKFSNPESIRRARQLIQKDDENLRGSSYKYKCEVEEKAVRHELSPMNLNL
jgi:hypothetical protein